MNKFLRWLRCEDANDDRKKRIEIVRKFHTERIKTNSSNTELQILTENIIDLNYSTTKYSRILIVLTVILTILTLIMAAVAIKA